MPALKSQSPSLSHSPGPLYPEGQFQLLRSCRDFVVVPLALTLVAFANALEAFLGRNFSNVELATVCHSPGAMSRGGAPAEAEELFPAVELFPPLRSRRRDSHPHTMSLTSQNRLPEESQHCCGPAYPQGQIQADISVGARVRAKAAAAATVNFILLIACVLPSPLLCSLCFAFLLFFVHFRICNCASALVVCVHSFVYIERGKRLKDALPFLCRWPLGLQRWSRYAHRLSPTYSVPRTM